jgi:hypothetical protein
LRSVLSITMQDHVQRLLDDSKLRDELVVFGLGEDQGLVNTEHRVELIPVCAYKHTKLLSSCMPSLSHSTPYWACGRYNRLLSESYSDVLYQKASTQETCRWAGEYAKHILYLLL